MKNVFLILAALIIVSGCGNRRVVTETKKPSVTIFDEIRARINDREYDIALELLEFTQLHNAEYFYLLSYTYDGLASPDGGALLKTDHEFAVKASEAMEKCISIDPSFSKLIILNPYDKLSSIWASLAMRYVGENNLEKAKWCFEEGKKRGAFYRAYVEFGHNLLSSCDTNSILLTNGDMDTFSALYWQIVHNYRTDINVVCLSLLNSPKLIQFYIEKGVDFGIEQSFLGSLRHQLNPFSSPYQHHLKNAGFQVTIPDKSSKETMFVQDMLLVNMINANYTRRAIYFAISVSDENIYAFGDFLRTEGIVQKISSDQSNESAALSLQKLCSNLLTNYKFDGLAAEPLNHTCPAVFNNYVSVYLEAIDEMLRAENREMANKLIAKARESLPAKIVAPEQKKDLEKLASRAKALKPVRVINDPDS